MRLSHVHIRNFRSIENIEIGFEPRCRILVGLNEAGKSNVLSALALLDKDRVITDADIREVTDGDDPQADSLVTFWFKFEASERLKIIKAISAFINEDIGQIFAYKGEALSGALLDQWFSSGQYEIDVRNKKRTFHFWPLDDDLTVSSGWMVSDQKVVKTHSPSNSINLSTLLVSNKKVVHIAAINEADLSKYRLLTIGDISELVREAVSDIVETKLPACMYWSYTESSLLPGRISIKEFEQDPSICEPLRQMFALAGFPDVQKTIADYRHRQNGLRNLLHRIASATTLHIREVWKEAAKLEISLQPDGDFIDASVKDEHNYFAVNRRSDGFKRFISFLILVSAKAKTKSLINTLYLHDEPDLGIHPSGISYLLNELIKISKENYVVVSTHSIFMVDKERIDRHLLVSKKNEKTLVAEANASNVRDEEVVFNALGFSLFQNIRSKNIIFEGWRDKHLFRIFLATDAGKNIVGDKFLENYGLCHAKGVKDIISLAQMIEIYGATAIAVSDGDQVAKEAQARFVENRPRDSWLRYDEFAGLEIITAEDFIAKQALIKALSITTHEHAKLQVPDVHIFDAQGGVVEAVKQWLRNSGISADETKPLLNSWKNSIFDNLMSDEIDSKYELMVKAIFDKIN